MKTDLRSYLKKEFSKIGIKATKSILTDIVNALNKYKDEVTEDLSILQIYTIGEYRSTLMLTDKEYRSRLHTYGLKESLVYSYTKIIPGFNKYHKKITSRGTFKVEKEVIKPFKIADDENNILIIKSDQWDSYNGDNHNIKLIIFVYNKNNFIQEQRNQAALKTIFDLQNKLKKGGLR